MGSFYDFDQVVSYREIEIIVIPNYMYIIQNCQHGHFSDYVISIIVNSIRFVLTSVRKRLTCVLYDFAY